MIFYDVTKAGQSGHRSGLMRVSVRLQQELGAAATEVRWQDWNRAAAPDDWFLTAELFSEEERPGFSEFLQKHSCHLAAIFHDAIPLRFPQTTWPQSVARHPGYMKLLAGFDRVWAVSEASRRDLLEFWRWQGVAKPPPVHVLALGADFNGRPRVTARNVFPGKPSLLGVGIVEPRKNQSFLLQVCSELWEQGLDFDLHLAGRVNPYFGPPIVARIKELKKRYAGLNYHNAPDDAVMAALYAGVRASVFPTLAEGCGLPLLESLWMGVPCVCSDLPVLRENADGGGCLTAAPNDLAAWREALREVLTDDALAARLQNEATTRVLPTWRETAETLAG